MEQEHYWKTYLRRMEEAEDAGPIVRTLEPYDMLLVWNAADDEQKIMLLQSADPACSHVP